MVILLLAGCPGDSATESGVWPDSKDSVVADSPDVESGDSSETGVGGEDLDADGYASVATGGEDCDDGDASIHPGAQEWCDEVDWDCDGDPLAAGVCGLTQPLTTRAHELNPEWIQTMFPIRDVTGDGLDDVLAATSAGTVGITPGTGDLGGLASWNWIQEWEPWSMECLRNPPGIEAGDIDGDGYNDVAIEAPDCVGGVVIAWGPVDASEASSVLTEWPGPDPSYDFTYLRVADVNGDGASDLLRAPKVEGEALLEIFFGGSRTVASGFVDLVQAGEMTASTGGDSDGDGCDDLILSSAGDPSSWLRVTGLSAGDEAPEGDLDRGTLGDPEASDIGSHAEPSWLAVGDWSGDGLDDVVLLSSGHGSTDPGYLLFYDDMSQPEVYASAVVENNVSYDQFSDSTNPRFATGGGILRHDDVPVALHVTSDTTTASTIVIPASWPSGTLLLSELEHFVVSDQTDDSDEPFHGQGDAWGRGDLDGDGWSDVLGTVCDKDYVTCTAWIFGPFDDIPWGESHYW